MKGTVKVKLEMLPTRGPSIDFNIEASCSLSKVGDIALTDESIRDEICKAVRAAFDAEIDEVRRKFGELETHATFVRGAPVVERGAMDVPLTDDELASSHCQRRRSTRSAVSRCVRVRACWRWRACGCRRVVEVQTTLAL